METPSSNTNLNKKPTKEISNALIGKHKLKDNFLSLKEKKNETDSIKSTIFQDKIKKNSLEKYLSKKKIETQEKNEKFNKAAEPGLFKKIMVKKMTIDEVAKKNMNANANTNTIKDVNVNKKYKNLSINIIPLEAESKYIL